MSSMRSRPFPRCWSPIFWRGLFGLKRTWSTNCSIRARSAWPEHLLLLANFGKEGQPEPIIAKISQETLAEMIGTTRSRVSYFMNKFRKLGLIAYNGQIEIHRSLMNASFTRGRTSTDKHSQECFTA